LCFPRSIAFEKTIGIEERMLCGKIRTVVDADTLLEAERQLRNKPFNDVDWKDPFWKT